MLAILANAGRGEDASGAEPVSRDSGGLPTVRASDVSTKPIAWLWDRRIPFGKLSLLDGDPGLGKSTLALDIAARVTRGDRLPGDRAPRQPGSVLVLAAEDDAEDTLVPRLEAARADRARVHILQAHSTVTFPDGASDLEDRIHDCGIRLVLIDPLAAFMRCNDGRQALSPLVAVARRTGAAVLMLRHWAKTARGLAIYQGLGGIGISAVVRSGLLLAKDPGDENALVLASYKSNLAERPSSLRLSIVEGENARGRVEWLGDSAYTADELTHRKRGDEGASAVSQARGFLLQVLEEHGGSVGAEVAKEQARRAGIATRTLERASRDLVSSRRSGFQGQVLWSRLRDAGADGAAETGKVLSLVHDDPTGDDRPDDHDPN